VELAIPTLDVVSDVGATTKGHPIYMTVCHEQLLLVAFLLHANGTQKGASAFEFSNIPDAKSKTKLGNKICQLPTWIWEFLKKEIGSFVVMEMVTDFKSFLLRETFASLDNPFLDIMNRIDGCCLWCLHHSICILS
jgi:hypothetical protein